MDTEPIVRFESVTRRYGALLALDRLSFTMERGEMFGLVGPDGGGKTTALRLLLGLLPADSGRITACGIEPWQGRKRLARRLGYLSQRFSLYGDLTVDENLAFFAAIHGTPDWKRRRGEILERVRLAPFRERLADHLSGGMKQKLALACTLIHTPELLVLDEPTTGVDPVSRRDFWTLLSELQRDGLTLLVTTPYLDEAERCHRVALLGGGRLLALDTPRALRASLPGLTAEIVAHPRRDATAWLRARPDVASVQAFGERLHVRLPGGARERGAEEAGRLGAALAAAGFAVDSARPIEPSLEDLFIARMGGDQAAPPPAEVP
jgi:drug efflux transport system ATP-binding protein